MAPKAARGRDRLVQAFTDFYAQAYCDANHMKDPATIVHGRAKISQEYGMRTDDMARMDLGHLQALVTNTVPACLWMLLRILSSADYNTWGGDADEFKPERFMPKTKTKTKTAEAPRIHPAAFRPFGGGTILCPGRTFAYNVVVAFVAVMLSGFDIHPRDAGPWPDLQPAVYTPSLGLWKVANVEWMNVEVKRRKGWEHVDFSFAEA